MREAFALLLASLVSVQPASIPEGSCQIEQVAVSWGFKESFRSYISGAIADGSWETTGDVGYAIPEFRFTDGEGYVSPDRVQGVISFEGTLVFSGHGGILETSLSQPELHFQGPREALLIVDVAGDTMDEVSVNQKDVPFAEVTWDRGSQSISRSTGVWEVEDAQVVLTADGSAAFGTYPEGEVMDPMSLRIQVEPGCFDEGGVWWIPGGVVALAVTAAAATVVIQRGRKSRGQERP